ncbi:Med18 protein [Rhizoctonia solani]|uniref:Mediator of RNA polymerase II transcription subunit 18 n=2 Tax=Rhizoctonia solani TaxID=456999 RepID=A0A8H7IND5_9AGAM|nr:Med18 protein [Rhizoctonia solani]
MATATSLTQNQTPLSYEVSLWGEITGDEEAINPVINRFTLSTETTQKLDIRDIIFEPNEEPAIGEPLYLRCRRDNTKSTNPWMLFTYGRPQPERISPDAIVRPVATMNVNAGNVMAFASALGYRIKTDFIKEGYLFTKGNMTIQMFRQPKPASKESEVIDLDPEPENEQSWNVEIRQYPVVSVKDTSITEAIDNVLSLNIIKSHSTTHPRAMSEFAGSGLGFHFDHSRIKTVEASRTAECTRREYLRSDIQLVQIAMSRRGQSRIAEQELPEIKDGISVCRVGVARGGSQFEVWDGENTWLAELPKRFRNIVWVRRGSYVLVDTTHGSTGSNVKGEITFVLQKDHIADLKKRGEWPIKIEESQNSEEQTIDDELEASHSDEGDETDESDPDLFKNPNRR